MFTGTFDLAAVESVCGGDEVVDVLGRLVRKSLVVAEEILGESRYRLLEMIRQYARQRLAEADETAALAERHARWYGSLPERAGPAGTESRLRLLDLEPDNLRAALGWLLDHDSAAALRLADSLGDWWMMRGRLVEGREWLEAAVARSSQATAADASALLRAAGFAGRSGGMSDGDRLVERGLAISRELGDRTGVSKALQVQGVWAWLRGPFATARGLLEEAAAEASEAGSPVVEANAMHALGLVHASSRDLPRAREALETALALLERSPDDAGPDFVAGSMGFVPLVVPGRPVERAVQEDSQITFRRVGPRAAVGYVRASLAIMARLEGDPAGADVLLGDALARMQAIGDEAGVAHVLAGIGRLATIEGERERAWTALRESLALRRRLGDVRSVGLTLALLAELAAAGGDLELARSQLERAVAMFDDVGDRPGRLWVLLALAHWELTAGAPEVARTHLERALATCEELGTRVTRGWTRAALAETDLHAAIPERARRVLEGARGDFEYCGDAWGLERCDVLLSRC